MSIPIRIKRVRPGDDTDAYCGRCKAERTHQVVALNADGNPATVICRTCGGQHRFRAKEKLTNSSTRGGGRTGRRSADPARDVPAGPLRHYSPKEIYAEGDWVNHPKFGQGKVALVRGGKVEVRFESGSRLLVHAG